jgi:16S rRNA (guanine966-N2)-methyltransferase
MRITGGSFGGRTLKTPDGMRVRPTADKVRQAIFNVLQHHDFGNDFALDGARAIDLFAGTGALGIEALSHGARFCLFVDDSADSRGLIRENVEALQLTGVSKIWRRDAGSLGPHKENSGGPFELAFLDPPYRKGLIGPALTGLANGGWLSPSAVIVVETAADEDRPAADGFTLGDERLYGDTKVAFLTPHP